MTKDNAIKLALEAAYLAGFDASGEGYNAEYPFGDHARNPEEDAVWIKDRDNALSKALAEQPAQQEPATKDVVIANMGKPFTVKAYVTPQPAQQCKWPTCQREDYQQALAEQIKRELVGEQPAQREPEQGDIFCGVDFTDGMLSVSVLRRRADDVAELLHAEQIELPAQPQPAGLLQEIARLHDRIKELEKDVEFLSLPAQQEPVAQWQLRHHLHTDGVWENCTDFAASQLQKEATFEIRRLYTSPQPAQQEQEQEQEPVAHPFEDKSVISALSWAAGLIEQSYRVCGGHTAADSWLMNYADKQGERIRQADHREWEKVNGRWQVKATPPTHRTWVGLTDERIKEIYAEQTGFDLDSSEVALMDFARALETAHGIKEST